MSNTNTNRFAVSDTVEIVEAMIEAGAPVEYDTRYNEQGGVDLVTDLGTVRLFVQDRDLVVHCYDNSEPGFRGALVSIARFSVRMREELAALVVLDLLQRMAVPADWREEVAQ